MLQLSERAQTRETALCLTPLTWHVQKRQVDRDSYEMKNAWNRQKLLEKVQGYMQDHHFLISKFTKATVVKTVWYQNKDYNRDEWNRVESLEINSYVYGQQIFNKSAIAVHWRKCQAV